MEQKNINQRRRTKKATALTKVSEDLLLAQKEIKGIDPENTIGGKIISAASYAIGAVLVATGVGAPVAPCIVPAGKVVNYIWLNKKVIYYTGAEGFASWQHQFADRKYNQAQDNAPDLHSAAITKEEKARNDEAKKSQKLALILARSATTPCEQWVSNIEQLIHADTALCQQLLAECKKDSQWSYTKTLDAWNQRMNVSNDNVASFEHQTSSKTEKLRQLYEQFSQANEEANLRRAVAAGTEVEFKELCQKRELYEKELEEANEKLNLLQNNEVQNLERRNSKRRSTIQKQQEEIASITKLLQNVKETCELIKKKKKLDEAAALESKKTANKIGEAYAHEEVVVLRNYNRAKCRTQGDLQACKNGWPNQLDEIIREQEKKIEKAFEQAEIIPTKENWDEASQATETILSLYDEFIKNREVKLSAQEKKKKNPELEG